MTQYSEVKASRMLNPTSIDLGEFVINPYRGCEFGCLYCYVRSNKVMSREKRSWGSFVDVRNNALECLEKELVHYKPKSVLLGSTTECFQPIETKYRLTHKILELLNANGVFYTILTRSPLIIDSAQFLKKGFCKKIYFTVNNIEQPLKNILEPKSPSFDAREKAIKELLTQGINVVPYFSPILPEVSDWKESFAKFSDAPEIEFEGLNFNLSNIKDIIEAVGRIYPNLHDKYEKMLNDKAFYEIVWKDIKESIIKEAQKKEKDFDIYIHKFGGYFDNKYNG